jgi:hypothetical protein
MTGFLVSASTGTMNSIQGKLGAMLTEEYKQLKNLRSDTKFLKDELEVRATHTPDEPPAGVFFIRTA